MNNILLVEDDEMIVKGLKFTFEQNNFLVEIARNYQEALESIKEKQYDLAILDITLPDGNGLDLGIFIKKNSTMPIIFLTAKDEENVVVEGLEIGEDYIIKPFRPKELIVRINKILTRQKKNKVITVENVSIDLDKAEVIADNKKVNLTSLEYKILSLLFMNLDRVVTREVILDKIWDMDGNFVNDNTLSVYIKRIREKIDNENIIKTIKGIGYRVDSK